MAFPLTRVVVWGDPANGLQTVRGRLVELGLEVRAVSSFEEARAALSKDDVDLLVCWLGGASRQPLELLAWLHARPAEPPVVLVTTEGYVGRYLEAMRLGAFDCVGLPLDPQELARIVTRALESRSAHSGVNGG